MGIVACISHRRLQLRFCLYLPCQLRRKVLRHGRRGLHCANRPYRTRPQAGDKGEKGGRSVLSSRHLRLKVQVLDMLPGRLRPPPLAGASDGLPQIALARSDALHFTDDGLRGLRWHRGPLRAPDTRSFDAGLDQDLQLGHPPRQRFGGRPSRHDHLHPLGPRRCRAFSIDRNSGKEGLPLDAVQRNRMVSRRRGSLDG